MPNGETKYARRRYWSIRIHSDDSKRLAELRLEFSLIVNPLDREDARIVSLIRAVTDENAKQRATAEFADRVALLLKHDWERAKREAASALQRLQSSPPRVTYEELLRRRSSRGGTP